MISKHNTELTNAAPLPAAWQIKLDSDPRVASYFTEADETARIVNGRWRTISARLICIELADGYNYEGRGSIIACDLRDLKDMMSRVEIGAATE
jgi:hypothetical protein